MARRRSFSLLLTALCVASAVCLAQLVVPTGAEAALVAARKAPPAPRNVRAARYGNAFLVSWDPVPDPRVAGYNLYRGYFKLPLLILCCRVNPSPIVGCSFLDTSVCDTAHPQYYWVTAVSGCAESQPGGPARIDPRVPDTSPPRPPWGLQAEVPATGVRLTWSGGNVEPDFAGYNLYRVEEGKGATRLNPVPLRELFFYHAAGKDGETYEARSVDTSGNESAGAWAVASPVAGEVLEFVGPSQNGDPRVSYRGQWVCEYAPCLHGGQLVASAVEPGAADVVAVEVTFEGTSVELYCARYWQCGWCEVFLDGVSRGRVNLSIDSDYIEAGYLLCAATSLQPGSHTLKVVNVGVPGPQGFPYGIVNVDYLVLR